MFLDYATYLFLAITYSSMYLGSFLIIIGITGLFLPAYFQDLKRKKYLLFHYGNFNIQYPHSMFLIVIIILLLIDSRLTYTREFSSAYLYIFEYKF